MVLDNYQWFLRGVQSVVFYYVACTPYYSARSRRRQKKQRELDKSLADANRAANPGYYRQPSPQATNPYWAEELLLGPCQAPGNQKKNLRKEIAKASVRNNQKQASELTQAADILEHGNEKPATPATTNSQSDRENIGDPTAPDSTHLNEKNADTTSPTKSSASLEQKTYGTNTDPEKGKGKSTETLPSGSSDVTLPSAVVISYDKMRTERRQRSDEDLWLDGPVPENVKFKPTYYQRNPQINEWSPPIVSDPKQRENGVAWMKQPPPVPSVMMGRTPPLTTQRSKASMQSKKSSIVSNDKELQQASTTTIKSAQNLSDKTESSVIHRPELRLPSDQSWTDNLELEYAKITDPDDKDAKYLPFQLPPDVNTMTASPKTSARTLFESQYDRTRKLSTDTKAYLFEYPAPHPEHFVRVPETARRERRFVEEERKALRRDAKQKDNEAKVRKRGQSHDSTHEASQPRNIGSTNEQLAAMKPDEMHEWVLARRFPSDGLAPMHPRDYAVRSAGFYDD